MSKKFVTKPIRKSTSLVSPDRQSAVDEIVDFYKKTEVPMLQKPVGSGLWIIIVLVSMLFGFSSGLVYNFIFPGVVLTSGNSGKVVIDRQENITVTADDQLREVIARVSPTVVNFYYHDEKANGPFYHDNNSFGSGFILTSDGWILTSQMVIDRIGDRDYFILTPDYHFYKPQKILKDPASSAVFLKILAADLPVIPFASVEKSFSGEEVYAFIASYPGARVASLHLADLKLSALENVVDSSENFNHFISCREGYDPSLSGSPIVNLSGEMVALILNERHALPLAYFETILPSISRRDKIERAYLGVHYISLAKYPKIDIVSQSSIASQGALLSGYKNLTAVVAGSPAAQAGLKVGDIITLVEDESLDGRKTLTEIIQSYKPGTELKITYLRGDKERLATVKLGSYE